MNVDPVTSRWAGALFNLARKHNTLDAVERDLKSLDAALSTPAVQAYFFGGTTDSQEKRGKLAKVLEGFEPLTRDFVNLLFDKRREGVLRHLGEAFRGRQLALRGAVEGIVESPRPLGESEVAELARSLGARLGKEVLLENRIDEELVGGVRVFVDAKMIDFSVQGRLRGLRRKMMDAELPTPV